MLAITKSIALHGLDGFLVYIQVDISKGMPSFEIVGLPDTIVKESKERVRTAIRNIGENFLSRKIVVNLAPANVRKEGSIFDLAIAIGILVASNSIRNENIKQFLEETIFIGELSLDGKVEKINGILPICIEARNIGIKRIIIPKKNCEEVSIVRDIEIIPVDNLREVIQFLNHELEIKSNNLKSNDIFLSPSYNIDFSEVRGQEHAKRALEISAAGGHNCLLIGSPGTGKTMLARRLPTILPDMTLEEMLEVSKIYSIVGLTSSNNPLINKRPFRSPHHTITKVSLVGGGNNPMPRRNKSITLRSIIFR